jgi:hypothetical protein
MEKSIGIMNYKDIHPFNNKVETGLRVLSILNAAFPNSYDLQSIVYLDYLTVHSGDIKNGIESLHPSVPNRKGEMFVRREIINSSLELYISKGLINKMYLENGIEYVASENSTTFLDSLNEEYLIELQLKSKWVNDFLKNLKQETLKNYMLRYMTDNSIFKVNIISNE